MIDKLMAEFEKLKNEVHALHEPPPTQNEKNIHKYADFILHYIKKLSNEIDSIFSKVMQGNQHELILSKIKCYLEDYLDESYKIIFHAKSVLRQSDREIEKYFRIINNKDLARTIIYQPELIAEYSQKINKHILHDRICGTKANLEAVFVAAQKNINDVIDGLLPEILSVVSMKLEHKEKAELNLEALYQEKGLLSLELDIGEIYFHYLEILNFLKGHPEIKILDLSGSKVTDDDLSFLEHCIFIEELSLAECGITPKGLKNLQKMPNLKRLNVSYTNCGNRGAKILSQIISLERLIANGANITDAGVIAFSHLPHLAVLSLSYNDIASDGAKALAKMSQLTSLFLSNMAWKKNDLIEVIKNSYLKTLALDNVQLKEEVWDVETFELKEVLILLDDEFIEKLVTHNKTLTTLNLAHNKITSAGVECLVKHPTLIKLDLSCNAITDTGAAALANCNFISLNLSDCHITSLGVEALANNPHLRDLALSHMVLEEREPVFQRMPLISLNLSCCHMTKSTLNAIAHNKSLRELTMWRVEALCHEAKAFADNSNIKKLTLFFGKKFASAEDICLLLKMKELTKLYLHGGNMSEEEQERIAEIVSTHATLEEFRLSGVSLSSAAAISLSKNERLRKLHIEGVKIGAEGAIALAAMKDCEIILDEDEEVKIFEALGEKDPVVRFNKAIKINQTIQGKDGDNSKKQLITPAFPTLFRQCLYTVRKIAASDPDSLAAFVSEDTDVNNDEFQLPEPIMDALYRSRF